MTDLQIIEELKEIFHLVINKNADLSKITIDSRIVEDLGLSSVAIIYLVIAIEQKFKISLENITVNTFKTIKDLVVYIQEKKLD
jgi:acyl carrier protein